jgi:hypothetical protein
MKLLVSLNRVNYVIDDADIVPEDNEISFPDGAKITNLVSIRPLCNRSFVTDCTQEFPDDDWWMGEYGGKSGLFPSNYVQLDE